ncbi:hypothetical protein [Butyrivibrio sp. INlla16]|uniref:hypothetical protein n=1 Tax=Butyrivibrio sp. INlla16 TaxID=1520807 RepID=UPI0008801585|nr:hypothetical protein [Butyrivibrio sp. INlla16]SDB04354.1 hypothetical protein SAMN02910263_00171 [Butyrivibrio sp. INlla16]
MSIVRFLFKVLLFPLFLVVFTLSLFVKVVVNVSGVVAGVAFLLGIVIIIYNISTHCVFGVCMTFVAAMMIAGAMLALGYGEYLLDRVIELYQDI